jgi:hypothetical protein
MALAASIPRSLWEVYLRASQAFPLTLIHRAQDNKTQNHTTTSHKTGHRKKSKQPTKKKTMDSPQELSMGFKFVEFFFFSRKV